MCPVGAQVSLLLFLPTPLPQTFLFGWLILSNPRHFAAGGFLCGGGGGGPDFSIVVRSALVSPLRGEPIRTGLGLDPWGHRLGSYRGRPGGRCPDTGLQVTPRTHSWSDGVADLLVHVAILHFLCVSVDVVWV